jgi:hypothetical protein
MTGMGPGMHRRRGSALAVVRFVWRVFVLPLLIWRALRREIFLFAGIRPRVRRQLNYSLRAFAHGVGLIISFGAISKGPLCLKA